MAGWGLIHHHCHTSRWRSFCNVHTFATMLLASRSPVHHTYLNFQEFFLRAPKMCEPGKGLLNQSSLLTRLFWRSPEVLGMHANRSENGDAKVRVVSIFDTWTHHDYSHDVYEGIIQAWESKGRKLGPSEGMWISEKLSNVADKEWSIVTRIPQIWEDIWHAVEKHILNLRRKICNWISHMSRQSRFLLIEKSRFMLQGPPTSKI